ncbi:uncharacterized protein JCM6883_000235 [Sporobolomyces salmoneus]|uniref:uncharacterized protein n=1 Tax=Sporobolomyces salmoneus TaxID=183962 RepID=UPI003178BAEF
MPGLVNKPTRTATINFVEPKSKIPEKDQERYLARYDVNDLPPKDTVNVPLHDLRDEFERLGSAEFQLDERGYAAIKHTSAFASIEGLKAVETTNAYLKECCELYKDLLGADEVVAWNSVIRSNDETAIPDVKETRQKAVQQDVPPAETVKAISSSAHVDQDEEYARVVAKRAAGEDVFEKYRRIQIVNLWRPLQGPVTNAPLAVCSYRSMNFEKDLMRCAGAYGTHWSISHSPQQQWSYISHQMPDEALLLRCYDSEMGSRGQALFSAHTAVDVIDEPLPAGIEEGTPLVPRTSVEVRLIVLHK